MTTPQKRFFIYDTSKGYSRLIKQKYGKTFVVTQCKHAKKTLDSEIENNDFAFVIINEEDDIAKLHLIHSKIKRVFFGFSSIKHLNVSVFKTKGLIYLDLFQNKDIFLNYIDTKLKELGC